MTDDDVEKTVIASRRKPAAEEVDDETVISSRAPEIDETVISSRAPEIDETVIISRDVVDDKTVMSRRGDPDIDKTVLVKGEKKPSVTPTSGAMFTPPAPAPRSIDDTVIGTRNADVDATVISSRKGDALDETIISSRRTPDDSDETVITSRHADDTVIAGARAPREPEARAGTPQQFVRPGEPVVERVERVDYGTPPPRIQSATDPAFLYETTVKQRQKRARRLVVLLIASAVTLGVILAVAIVLLSRP